MSELNRDSSIDVQGIVNKSMGAQHGDVVVGSDGVAGIVIDPSKEMDKYKSEQHKAIENVLKDQSTMIEEAKKGQAIEGIGISKEAREQELANLQNIKTNPEMRDHMDAIMKVAAEADRWEPTATGMARKDSAEAKAFDKVINGQSDVDLSGIDIESLKANATVEQYGKPVEPISTPEPAEDDKIAAEYINENDTTAKVSDNGVVEFKVPEGQVRSFIGTLPEETVGHVARAKTIIVNEVKKKNVPTKTRKIRDISEFKRVVSVKMHSEVEFTALPNSGYYATFKGCGSLAMATLVPDREGQPIDYNKRYQFCYDNLVDTSIGKLSFSEFCAYTAVADLDLCIFAILRASDPDENSVTLVCGNQECRREYDVKYKMSQLINPDSLSTETLTQVKAIIDNKDIYENAKKVFDASPMSQVKSMDITDDAGTITTINMKQPNGTITIERTPILQELSVKFNQYIASLLIYIPTVSITVNEDGDDVEYEIDDPEAIATILADLDDESLTVVTQLLQGLVSYDAPTYSFKGDFECPDCHRKETSIDCDVNTLVFHKVSKAIQ